MSELSLSMAEFLWERDRNLYILALISLALVIVWYLTRRSLFYRSVLGALAIGSYLLILLAGLLERAR